MCVFKQEKKMMPRALKCVCFLDLAIFILLYCVEYNRCRLENWYARGPNDCLGTEHNCVMYVCVCLVEQPVDNIVSDA